MTNTPDTSPEAVEALASGLEDMVFDCELDRAMVCERPDFDGLAFPLQVDVAKVHIATLRALSAERDAERVSAINARSKARLREKQSENYKTRAEAADAERNQWRKAYHDAHELFVQSDEKRMAAEAERDTLKADLEFMHNNRDKWMDAAQAARTERDALKAEWAEAVRFFEAIADGRFRTPSENVRRARAFLARHQKGTKP